MSSAATAAAPDPEPPEQHGEELEATNSAGISAAKLEMLRIQIINKRSEYIEEKFKKNKEFIRCQVSADLTEASRRGSLQAEENTIQMLSSRIHKPLRKFGGRSQGYGKKNRIKTQNVSRVRCIKIPYLERLPRFSSWVHLPRNQKMAEDQSVIGRRQIYYDKDKGETVLSIDKDGDAELEEPEEAEPKEAEPEEAKHEFSQGDDQILWVVFEEHGLTTENLFTVGEFFQLTTSEIEDRYKHLKEKNMRRLNQHSEDSGDCESHFGICLDKSLSAALDAFDNLFCRQCLVFDCPLHGCSQPLIHPCEKQLVWSEPEGDKKPCSDQCYFQGKKNKTVEEVDGILTPSTTKEPGDQSTKAILPKERLSFATAAFTEKVAFHEDLNSDVSVLESTGKRKCYSMLSPDGSQNSCKRIKRISDDIVTASDDYEKDLNLHTCDEEKHTSTCASSKSFVEHTSSKLIVSGSTCHGEHEKGFRHGQKDITKEMEFERLSNSMEVQVDGTPRISDWKPLEKELYLKGVEIFGRNSCLISRNLLSGLKTCMEVGSYMYDREVSMAHNMDKNGEFDIEYTDKKIPSRSLRKKGKTKKFRYSSKSTRLRSMWRRITYRKKDQPNKQYKPCGCEGICGKECPCVDIGSCCEKYCGCSKLCRNRFRGCHCAKGQCRTRQCPCFAANRECDPDVCQNCWVSCGDGSLGEPPQHGDGQCRNMGIRKGEKQRILWAKSDIVGWGAFLKNAVDKNDLIGEYTGELVSHLEADKRGKIYDRINSSYLFNLNDQYVLDAYRQGDKLKFANHSPKPNCYAKVLFVDGDHRVGIFAKERIEAGKEILYDYNYHPDCAPAPWALKTSGRSKVSQGAAKKHSSH